MKECKKNTFSERSLFFFSSVTKIRGSSTTTTNAEVMLIKTDMYEVIEHSHFYLHHVLGHEKACDVQLFYNQILNLSNWTVA